jgi:hypothetical protein
MRDSMDLSVDFTDPDIKGGGDFEALPAGKYLATITDWDVREVKNAGKLPVGTPGLNVEFTIADGEYENRKVWTNYWLHPNNLGFFKTFLKAAGMEDDDINAITDAGDAVDRVVGTDVCVKLRRREYPADSGDYVNDVNGVQPKEKYRGGSSSSEGSLLP